MSSSNSVSLVVVLVVAAVVSYVFLNTTTTSNAYILQNTIHHTRFIPAFHSFSYPSIALLLPLPALESPANPLALLRGLLFSYNSLRSSLLSIRPSAYLFPSPLSIFQKLHVLISQRGYDPLHCCHTAWMLSMPTYCGIEGINPLTVYYCYSPDSLLSLVVLEIHNTFNERHIHILQPGIAEDTTRCPSYDHKWTFPRQFHVSPFNDRSGFYSVSLTAPSHSPSTNLPTSTTPPLPSIHISLLTSHPTPQLKLLAILSPHTSLPFTPSNTLKLLLKYPFTLFLSFPRILYQAALLHYSKRLCIYARPEPIGRWDVEAWIGKDKNPVQGEWGACPLALPSLDTNNANKEIGDSVMRQPLGILDKWSMHIVDTYLEKRSKELGYTISLVSTDPTTEIRFFPSSFSSPTTPTLSIHYRSPLLFQLLLLSSSASHILHIGDTHFRILRVSSPEIFERIFTPTTKQNRLITFYTLYIQTRFIRSLLPKVSCPPLPPTDEINYPPIPPSFKTSTLLTLLYISHLLERGVYKVMRARFVDENAGVEIKDLGEKNVGM